jgi:ribosomal protein S24E
MFDHRTLVGKRYGGTIVWHAMHKKSGKMVPVIHKRHHGVVVLHPLNKIVSRAAVAQPAATSDAKNKEQVYREIANAFGRMKAS